MLYAQEGLGGNLYGAFMTAQMHALDSLQTDANQQSIRNFFFFFLGLRAGETINYTVCGRKWPVWGPVFDPPNPGKVYVGCFFAFFPKK